MEPREVWRTLVELAEDAGLVVRVVTDPGDGIAPESGVCRVGERWWVVVARADPLEERIELLAGALRTHAGAWLEDRFVPPAIRRLVDPES